MAANKRSSDDFCFDRIIGEGSFSVVYLARDTVSKMDVAVKVCEKSHIYRERMQKAILREKHIMRILTETPSPFIIQLYCTFQDETRLYFSLSYCSNGELLSFLNQREIFDEEAWLFYSAEIILALEHLHRLGIVHRDLKPENLLLNQHLHIQLSDFGSALLLNDPSKNEPACEPKYNNNNNNNAYRNRKNSFVGTAQYVSIEMLTNRKITPMVDIWAFACILYQMITNKPPFNGGNEYLIFQKIQNLEYTFPDDFPTDAKHLIQSILKIDSTERIGAKDDLSIGGYESIRNHPYFAPLNNDWDMLKRVSPQKLKSVAKPESLSELNVELSETGLNEKQITRLLGLALHDDSELDSSLKGMQALSPRDFEDRLERQKRTNKYHQFVENNLILKQGLIDKKKGFFPRRRMFLLTTGPHLYYVDPANMVLKGQVPFSKDMRTEAKNFRNFYVHVPNRTYILEDTGNNAPLWCEAIDDVRNITFNLETGDSSASSSSSSNGDNSLKNGRKSTSKNGLFNLQLRKISMNEKTN